MITSEPPIPMPILEESESALPIYGERRGKYKQLIAYAIVLTRHLPQLLQFSWHLRNGYPRTAVRDPRVPLRYRTIQLHRMVYYLAHSSTPKPPLQIDHIDRNPLNNVPSNLRPATKQQQRVNQPRPRNNTSGHKGVYWHKRGKSWIAQIKVNGKLIYLGSFKDDPPPAIPPIEAVQAYTQAHLRYFECEPVN